MGNVGSCSLHLAEPEDSYMAIEPCRATIFPYYVVRALRATAASIRRGQRVSGVKASE